MKIISFTKKDFTMQGYKKYINGHKFAPQQLKIESQIYLEKADEAYLNLNNAKTYKEMERIK